jgi:hypothetical protein
MHRLTRDTKDLGAQRRLGVTKPVSYAAMANCARSRAAVNRTLLYEFISARRRPPIRSVCCAGCSASATAPVTAGCTPAAIRAADRHYRDHQHADIAKRAWMEHRRVYCTRRLSTELHERGAPVEP